MPYETPIGAILRPLGLLPKPWDTFIKLLEGTESNAAGTRDIIPELGLSVNDILEKPHITTPQILSSKYFELDANAGGGDCLYYALEGRHLETENMLALRGDIAALTRLKDINGVLNAGLVAAALAQTPYTQNQAKRIMTGRAWLPAKVLASMRNIPKIYAGRAEIVHWCALRQASVLCFHSSGILELITAERIYEDMWDELDTISRSADVMIFKTHNHWSRIHQIDNFELMSYALSK